MKLFIVKVQIQVFNQGGKKHKTKNDTWEVVARDKAEAEKRCFSINMNTLAAKATEKGQAEFKLDATVQCGGKFNNNTGIEMVKKTRFRASSRNFVRF